MDVILVNVSGEDKFIFVAQDFPCQFHADPVGFLWRHFSRFKGLYQVAAQVRAFVFCNLKDRGRSGTDVVPDLSDRLCDG